MKKIAVIFLILVCFSSVAFGKEKDDFPWLIKSYKHVHLTHQQQRIYLFAFFETINFAFYNNPPREDPHQKKVISAWNDCVLGTKNKKTWTPEYGWMFGDDLDKSAAYMLYNVVSPIVCEEYSGKEDTPPKNLRLFNYVDWEKWSIKDKAVYISGYIDTVVSLQMRLRDAGMKNDLRDFRIVIEATGIDGILSDVMETDFNEDDPLILSIARGLGSARKRVFSH